MENILVIDDERSLVELLTLVFKKEGYGVKQAMSGQKALDILAKEAVDLVITDIRMPGLDGMEVLRRVRSGRPEVPVVMMTAYGTVQQAVEALKAGALDYVVKPFDVDELRIIVARGLAQKSLKEENVRLKHDLREQYNFENMVGRSRAMQEIFTLIEKVAPTDSTVLITGESGTGKEMAARAIHYQSNRKDDQFVSINCAALPESLLESELFGHVRGAFTGAVGDKKGMFEAASHGTLFLDEVGEMSALTQVKLLRALQERKIRRVGGTDEISIDVRILAATNQDLKKLISEGRFREDLFYRLNVLTVHMPALRHRTEDISVLVSHFLAKYCDRMGRKLKRLTPEVVALLEAYHWPGNIRELENVIERIVAVEDRETITPACLPPEIMAPTSRMETRVLLGEGFDLKDHLEEVTMQYMSNALAASGGVGKKAAELLGLSYRTFRYLCGKHGISLEGEAAERAALEDRRETERRTR